MIGVDESSEKHAKYIHGIKYLNSRFYTCLKTRFVIHINTTRSSYLYKDGVKL